MIDPEAVEELQRFESGLDPRHPEQSEPGATVLGYGEMSTVMALDTPGLGGFALKRMALFHTGEEVDAYEKLLSDYLEVLSGAGLDLPAQTTVRTTSGRTAMPVLYIVQERLDPKRIGNAVVREAPEDEAVEVVRTVLERAVSVIAGASESRIPIGLDSQISNWEVSPGLSLRYLDTGTPLMREDGNERLDSELFLRLCPAGLRWVLRRFFLQDVLDRFYDARLTSVDHVANLAKEGRADLIPAASKAASDVLRAQFGDEVAEVTAEEVTAFYRQDKLIWRLFLALRRLERAVTTGVRRKPYDVILPGRIRR